MTYVMLTTFIYSVLEKTVILIELTSPCEENFEDRHFDKISRYEALCVSIRENCWRHHLFAIEVGARGYCAYNVRSCFRRLGLNTKETKVMKKQNRKGINEAELVYFHNNKTTVHLGMPTLCYTLTM